MNTMVSVWDDTLPADPLQTQQEGEQMQEQDGQQEPDNGKNATGNTGEKQRRKRKRDAHQQELNKQAQHRYRCVVFCLISC